MFVTDRGPNVECDDTPEFVGRRLCHGANGKVFAMPDYAPSIYRAHVSESPSDFRVTAHLPLLGTDRKPIGGVSNPGTEPAFGRDGEPLPFDPNGVDPEAVVTLSDGSFYVAEEYAPSLLHVSPRGVVLERVVPRGVGKSLQGTRYAVREALPALARARRLNRGFEALAVSADEKRLFVAFQSPLSHPDTTVHSTSRNVRLYELALVDGVLAPEPLVAEYVYVLDLPDTFGVAQTGNGDLGAGRADVKISDAAYVGSNTLYLLERVTRTTKVYRVHLGSGTNIAGSEWSLPHRRPTLEQLDDLAKTDIEPLAKQLVASSLNRPEFQPRLEGLARTTANRFLLVNDNDFGIAGDATVITVHEL